jgi:hypothetical protein
VLQATSGLKWRHGHDVPVPTDLIVPDSRTVKGRRFWRPFHFSQCCPEMLQGSQELIRKTCVVAVPAAERRRKTNARNILQLSIITAPAAHHAGFIYK